MSSDSKRFRLRDVRPSRHGPWTARVRPWSPQVGPPSWPQEVLRIHPCWSESKLRTAVNLNTRDVESRVVNMKMFPHSGGFASSAKTGGVFCCSNTQRSLSWLKGRACEESIQLVECMNDETSEHDIQQNRTSWMFDLRDVNPLIFDKDLYRLSLFLQPV